jgi:two-component system LytT family response regulator
MSQSWTVVIVDDEGQSRRDLCRVIDAHPRFRIIGQAADGSAAVCLLDQLHPDLAVLGVELPGVDALDVLRALRPRDRPRVLFVADGGSLVVDALRGNSLDYLVRPFEERRVRDTLDVTALRLAESARSGRRRMERLLRTTRSPGRLRCLPVRRNGRIEVLELDAVDWISAAGNYVELHTNGRRVLHRIPLKDLAGRLDPSRFARIHRSTVVNLERVRDLEPTPQGDWKLDLDTGDRLRLSRRYRDALEILLPVRHQLNGYRQA